MDAFLQDCKLRNHKLRQHWVRVEGCFLNNLNRYSIVWSSADSFPYLTEGTFSELLLKYVDVVDVFNLLKILEVFHIWCMCFSSLFKHFVGLFLLNWAQFFSNHSAWAFALVNLGDFDIITSATFVILIVSTTDSTHLLDIKYQIIKNIFAIVQI